MRIAFDPLLGRHPHGLAPQRAVRVRITIYLALEIAEQEIVAVAANDGIGRQLDLATPARSVDDEHRRRVACGMAAQRADDLEAGIDRGAEVARAFDRIALVQIVRLHPAHQKAVHQGLDDGGIVVDALEQHGLRAERDARVGEPRRRFAHFRRQLVWVREVQAHPQRMMLLQHLHQVLRDALRQHGRDLGADADKLDVLDRAQASKQVVELVVTDRQRVAAREEHVANLGMLLEVAEREIPIADVEIVLSARVADEAGARAVAAIGGAGARGEEQHAVGIAVDETGYDGVVVLAKRVVFLAGQADIFVADHDVRAPQGLRRIVKTHEACVIGRDSDRKRASVARHRVVLILGEHEDAAELGEGADAGPQLPAPIVPFGGCGVGVEASIEGPGRWIDGEAECFLPCGRLDRSGADIAVCGSFGNRGVTRSLMPRRRAKIAPSQELEIHRYLIVALLTGPRRPQWLRPSNGPAGFYLEGLDFSSREKPTNTVNSSLTSNIQRSYATGLLNNSRRKTKFCWCSRAASWKTNDNVAKQTRASQLAQAFCESVQVRPRMIQRAQRKSWRSHRARAAMRGARG